MPCPFFFQASSNPRYDDAHSYPVAMTEEIDQYLKTNQLRVFCFDDSAKEDESFLGDFFPTKRNISFLTIL